MSDPIGTQGLKARPPDLELALAGGDQFVSRLRELNEAKKANEQALANLALGKEVRAAHAEARATVAAAIDEAKKYRATAAAELTTAKQVHEDAKAKADDIVAQAQATAKRIVDEANETRVLADKYARNCGDAADARVADAEAKLKAADAKLREAEASARDHKSLSEGAIAARKRAEEKQKELQAKIDQLHEAVRAVGG